MIVQICNKNYEIQDIKALSAKGFDSIIVELYNGEKDCLKLPKDVKTSASIYLNQIKNSLQMLTHTFGSKGGF